MYLADPVEAVHHVATLVRPGGVIVFQEYQLKFECLSRPDAVPLWEQWMAWVLGALDKAGVEMQMGLNPDLSLADSAPVMAGPWRCRGQIEDQRGDPAPFRARFRGSRVAKWRAYRVAAV